MPEVAWGCVAMEPGRCWCRVPHLVGFRRHRSRRRDFPGGVAAAPDGEFRANLIETVALVVVLALLIRLAVPWLNPSLDRRSLLRLGLFWTGLTLAFEFLFGNFVDGASWKVLLSNYNVAAGRLWILVPLTMGVGPALVGWLMSRRVQPILTMSGDRPAAPSNSPAAILG